MFPPKDLALWCSRLARQPVTLEVDGSSPFGVAIKSQICAMRKKTSSYASVAQLVEQRTENPRVVGSIPTGGTKFAGVAHPVERHLAKVEVASSSLVTRSIRYRGQVVRQESAKLSFASSNLAGTSKTKRTSERMSFLFWNEVCPGGPVKQPAAVKLLRSEVCSASVLGKLYFTLRHRRKTSLWLQPLLHFCASKYFTKTTTFC